MQCPHMHRRLPCEFFIHERLKLLCTAMQDAGFATSVFGSKQSKMLWSGILKLPENQTLLYKLKQMVAGLLLC